MSDDGRVKLRHGPGAYADADAPVVRWGGRKAVDYVARTLAEYGTVCINCGLPGSDSADHIIPRRDGGAVFDLANLGPAHRRCNYSRGAKPLRHLTIAIESGLSWFTA